MSEQKSKFMALSQLELSDVGAAWKSRSSGDELQGESVVQGSSWKALMFVKYPGQCLAVVQ